MAQSQRQNQVQIKVLRIGIVRDGKIAQEKLIRAGEAVTIGTGPKNTFSFPDAQLPKRQLIFEPNRKGDEYALHFTESMTGKLSYKDAIVELGQLSQSGDAVKRGDEYQLPLTDGNRGKVAIGNITVLFQFVPPPPEPMRASGKVDFRPRLIDEDDPIFYGFLGMFTAIATVFMIYVYNAPPMERVSLDDIPDRFTNVIMTPDDPPEVDIPEPEIDEDALSLESKRAEKEVEQKETEQKQVEKKEQTPEERAAAEAKRQEKMRQDAMEKSKLLMAIIGTRGESSADGKVEDLFSESDFAGQNLDQALKNVSGAELATGTKLEAKSGQGGARGDADIGDLKGAGEGSATVGSGPATKVSGSLQLGDGDASLEEGDASSIRKVVKKYSGQVKYCYESQLKSDPGLSGRVDVIWTIKDGRVRSASLFANTTGNDALGDCIVGKVKTWRFPTEAKGEIVYPFILTPSG